MPNLPPVSDLETHLGFWLRMVSNHVSHAFASRLAGIGVTVAEWCLLRMLYDKEPTPPSALAVGMGMTRGAITKLADRLIAKSLVKRKASKGDGRAQTLALTPRGIALVPQLAALADANDTEFFGSLSDDERDALAHTLKQLVERGRMTSIPVE